MPQPRDRIVVVMGPPGSGKSTFIKYATCQHNQIVSHGLQPCTTNIQTFRTTHPIDGLPVVFVDAPGSDDETWSVKEILSRIVAWLVKAYAEKVDIAAVIYLHRISDNRMGGLELKNLQEFEKSCCQQQIPNVIIATTMWSNVRQETGVRREEELKAHFWKGMVASGCRTERFGETYESAWFIIGGLADRAKMQVAIQWEIIDGQQSPKERNASIVPQDRENPFPFKKFFSRSYRSHMPKQDRIVAVMGPTGAGKSTFIDYATRQNSQAIGHGLRSCTEAIRTVRVNHPSDDRPVVFVDVPGFDSTLIKSDLEIFVMITDWFVKTYKRNNFLATIIYLHRITDNHMSGAMLKNLRMFASLCGQDAMPNVIVATTMWSEVKIDKGELRERELKKNFWNSMMDDGCKIERFEDSFESAWHIVGSLAENNRAPAMLALKVVDPDLRLNETQQAPITHSEEEKVIKDRKDTTSGLGEQAQNKDRQLVVYQRPADVRKLVRRMTNRMN